MKKAVINSNLKEMKRIKEQDEIINNKNEKDPKTYVWEECIFGEAAKGGNLKIMEWLKEMRCPWSPETFSYATFSGEIEVLKWLKANECPWGPNTFYYAVTNGNIKNMEWLVVNGCPWSNFTFSYAVQNDNLSVLKWLKEKGCPGKDTLYISRDDIYNISEKVVIWLNKNGHVLEFLD